MSAEILLNQDFWLQILWVMQRFLLYSKIWDQKANPSPLCYTANIILPKIAPNERFELFQEFDVSKLFNMQNSLKFESLKSEHDNPKNTDILSYNKTLPFMIKCLK